MSTSVLLLLVGAGCGAGFAALAVYGQVRRGGRLRDVGWGLPTGLLAAGTLFGALMYGIDSGVARVTLFEVDAEGSLGVPIGAPAPVREYDVLVEHPGIAHELFVSPTLGDTWGDPEGAVELQARRPGRWRARRPAAAAGVRVPPVVRVRVAGLDPSFTPGAAAAHRLSVTVITSGVPAVHLLVTCSSRTRRRPTASARRATELPPVAPSVR